LKDVADIIVESFYSSDFFAKSPWRHFYRLAELDRLQQNFPYYSDDEQRHSVFVAVAAETKQVIAFVDVDARPATRKQDAPRPYLSDLCISSTWRRRGIATSLVQTCERTVCHDMKRRELYIRVEQANHAAIQMYKNLHYQQQDHDYFGVEDTTMLLHKSLKRNDKESTTAVEVKDTVGEEMCLDPK
jgi:ribosomal protein S18 acetylase RimI-like enzyme